jgi:hypothetical protein
MGCARRAEIVESSLTSKLTGAVLGILPDPLTASGNQLLTKPFGEH